MLFSGSDELDLLELIQAVRKRNVELPMILRFPDIVQHRMAQLQGCFDTAIGKYGYQVRNQASVLASSRLWLESWQVILATFPFGFEKDWT